MIDEEEARLLMASDVRLIQKNNAALYRWIRSNYKTFSEKMMECYRGGYLVITPPGISIYAAALMTDFEQRAPDDGS